MSEPTITQKGPYAVDVTAGEKYWWCACGRSAEQPWCDGAHKGSGLKPNVFTAEKTGKVYLCGCRRTGKPPFCDGTHSKL